MPAHVLTDELLGKHFGILGTTGSGKSCAVVLLLRAILDQHPNGHVVMLDPHNEYATAFGDRAEVLDTDTLELPYWLLNFDELMEVLFGAQADEGSPEAAILADMIPQAKRDQIKDREKGAHFTIDTPVPYKFTDLIRHIDQEKWQEVRAQQHGDRRCVVREKWLEFTPGCLTLYAEWDPGMIRSHPKTNWSSKASFTRPRPPVVT